MLSTVLDQMKRKLIDEDLSGRAAETMSQLFTE